MNGAAGRPAQHGTMAGNIAPGVGGRGREYDAFGGGGIGGEYDAFSPIHSRSPKKILIFHQSMKFPCVREASAQNQHGTAVGAHVPLCHTRGIRQPSRAGEIRSHLQNKTLLSRPVEITPRPRGRGVISTCVDIPTQIQIYEFFMFLSFIAPTHPCFYQ